MKILVFDNYDSFTYNLVQMVKQFTSLEVDVHRNDKISLDEVDNYDKIILSPGPGIPEEAGILLPLIKRFASSKQILGVCLGHQAITEAFGGTISNLKRVFHGVSTTCRIVKQDSLLFNKLPNEFEAGRYHSWIVNEIDFPAELEITARDDSGYIMALQHKQYHVYGVQFHPESILTPNGSTIIKNWINQ